MSEEIVKATLGLPFRCPICGRRHDPEKKAWVRCAWRAIEIVMDKIHECAELAERISIRRSIISPSKTFSPLRIVREILEDELTNFENGYAILAYREDSIKNLISVRDYVARLERLYKWIEAVNDYYNEKLIYKKTRINK